MCFSRCLNPFRKNHSPFYHFIHSLYPTHSRQSKHSLSMTPITITPTTLLSPPLPLPFRFPNSLKETIPVSIPSGNVEESTAESSVASFVDRFLAKQILCHSVLRSHAVYCVRSCCFRSLPLFRSLLRFHGSGCVYHLRQ